MQFKLRSFVEARGEIGGSMLKVNGMYRFSYLRDFHDMRCKYDRVLSVIHQQINREPEGDEIFLILSKDYRKVRLFRYCIKNQLS